MINLKLSNITNLDLRFGAKIFEGFGEATAFQITENGLVKQMFEFPFGVEGSVFGVLLHCLVT